MTPMKRVLFVVLAACSNGKDTEPTDGVDPTVPPPEPTTPPEPQTPACRSELRPVDPAPVVEGDTVALELVCTSGASGPEYVPRLVRAPDGAVLDAAAWTVTFPTDLDDAGPHEVFVTIDVAGGVAENATYEVDVNDAGPGVAGNVPPDPAVYVEEFGLPVIWCDPTAALGPAYVASPCAVDGENYATSRMRVEGAAYPKPSYLIDFGATPLDGGPLDMNDKTTLALLTTFDDRSHVRQKLAHDLWKDLEDFWGVERPTADTEFVVLYVDSVYQGLYVATDPVDAELMEQQDLVGNANLYASVSDDANFRLTDALGAPKADLSSGWVKVEGGAGEADLEDLTRWAAESDSATVGLEAEQWIRTDEFMDWYLLASFAAAPGSAADDAYLYNDPVLPQFRYLPGDFVGSFGQDEAMVDVDVALFHDLGQQNRLFEHFLASSQLSFNLWGRYVQAGYPGAPFDTLWITGRLDEYYADIDASARRDDARWDAEIEAWFGVTGDFLAEQADLYDWVGARRAAYDAARP